MKRTLCNNCAAAEGLIPQFDSTGTNLTGSAPQLGKYLDHTLPGSRTDATVSIYSDPSYDAYQSKFFSTLHSGSYHVDERGRESMAFVFGSGIGFNWDDANKKPLYDEDAVRLVCFREKAKVHHYSQDSAAFRPSWCDTCGKLIV